MEIRISYEGKRKSPMKEKGMLLSEADQKQFKAKPAEFLEKAIKDYVKNSPNNRFIAFPGDLIWDEPLVGFAEGSDPLFQQYKTLIGDFHMTPREVMEMHIDARGWGDKRFLSDISVISFALPSALDTRLSNRKESSVCSVKWNHTRWQGQEFIIRLSHYLVSLIEGTGYYAITPDLEKWFEVFKLPAGQQVSKWSQRHIAYAAGLGTFSLSDGFITTKGVAVRLGSVVCNMALPATPRPYANHMAYCLFFNNACRKCIDRCPADAISEKGHDRIKCAEYLTSTMEIVKKEGRAGYIGNKSYYGCGMCQTKVPCEDRIPRIKTIS
jgi:epoxyqueuosine reductase